MYPIPANATRIRYLESSGTQYVDTGVAVSNPSTIRVEADEDVTQPFGFTHQRNAHGTWLASYAPSSVPTSNYVYYGTYTNRTIITANESRKTAVYDGASGFYENGVQLISFVAGIGTDSIAGRNWLFGAVWDFDASSVDMRNARQGKIYGLKVYVSGTLVRSFVPVRVGQVGYLFDRVSGQLFGNAGTGAFVLGPDTFQQGVVPTRMMVGGVMRKPYDSEVEYLESTGTQYIDTGVTPQNSPSAVIRAQYLGTGQSSAATMPLFGVRNYTGPMKAMNFWVQSSTLRLAVNYNARDTGWQTQTTNTTAFHDFGVSSTGGTYDGTQFVSYSESVADTGLSCLVGAVRQANVSELVVTRQVKLRIASFALYNGGVLAFDGIAVRKGTTGYLYDKVSKQLFGNAGTGAFVLGPDK